MDKDRNKWTHLRIEKYTQLGSQETGGQKKEERIRQTGQIDTYKYTDKDTGGHTGMKREAERNKNDIPDTLKHRIP